MVEMIACAGLDEDESAVAQIVEIVVQIASGDAQTVGYLLRRVAAVVGKEEYEVKLATVFGPMSLTSSTEATAKTWVSS